MHYVLILFLKRVRTVPKALPQKPPLSCTPSRQVITESILLVMVNLPELKSEECSAEVHRHQTLIRDLSWWQCRLSPPPWSLVKIKGLTRRRSVPRLARWFSRERCMPPTLLTWVWVPGLIRGQEKITATSSPLQMSAHTRTDRYTHARKLDTFSTRISSFLLLSKSKGVFFF